MRPAAPVLILTECYIVHIIETNRVLLPVSHTGNPANTLCDFVKIS